jgi:hypothetical protein
MPAFDTELGDIQCMFAELVYIYVRDKVSSRPLPSSEAETQALLDQCLGWGVAVG